MEYNNLYKIKYTNNLYKIYKYTNNLYKIKDMGKQSSDLTYTGTDFWAICSYQWGEYNNNIIKIDL